MNSGSQNIATCDPHLPPDPDGINSVRAARAGLAIKHFIKASQDHPNETAHALPDLLCNLMHWADRNGVDFDRALATATNHYGVEISQAGSVVVEDVVSVYRDFAKQNLHEDGSVEIDASAQVNVCSEENGGTDGAYVQSWHFISADAATSYIVEKLQEADLRADALIDLVYAAAVKDASIDADDVNDACIESQVEFLVKTLGIEAAYAGVLNVLQNADHPLETLPTP